MPVVPRFPHYRRKAGTEREKRRRGPECKARLRREFRREAWDALQCLKKAGTGFEAAGVQKPPNCRSGKYPNPAIFPYPYFPSCGIPTSDRIIFWVSCGVPVVFTSYTVRRSRSSAT